MMSRNGLYVFIAAALIIGLIGGYVFGSSTSNNSEIAGAKTNQDMTNLNATMELNNLLREHAVLGGTTLINFYDGKDTAQLETLMDENGNKVADFIINVYGTEVGNNFSRLWMNHMQEYKNYTNAKKNNDDSGMDSAKQNLNKIAQDFGTLLASQNLPASTITNLFNEHISGTLALVDAHADDDQTKEANLIKVAYDQAGKMAAEFSTGIISDHPDKFK